MLSNTQSLWQHPCGARHPCTRPALLIHVKAVPVSFHKTQGTLGKRSKPAKPQRSMHQAITSPRHHAPPKHLAKPQGLHPTCDKSRWLSSCPHVQTGLAFYRLAGRHPATIKPSQTPRHTANRVNHGNISTPCHVSRQAAMNILKYCPAADAAWAMGVEHRHPETTLPW